MRVHELHAVFFFDSFVRACRVELLAALHFHVSVADGSSNAGGRETIDFVSCQGRLFDTTHCSLCFAGWFVRTGNFKVCSWIEKTNFISFDTSLARICFFDRFILISFSPPLEVHPMRTTITINQVFLSFEANRVFLDPF